MTLKQATKQVIAELRKNHGGWFMAATSDELGANIFRLVSADRYDVLNSLCAGVRPCIMEYARGDCRKHRRNAIDALYAIILFVLVVCVYAATILP